MSESDDLLQEEVGAQWGRFLGKGFTTTPQYWFSDEDRVVVLTQVTLDGQTADQADVLTFRDDPDGAVRTLEEARLRRPDELLLWQAQATLLARQGKRSPDP